MSFLNKFKKNIRVEEDSNVETAVKLELEKKLLEQETKETKEEEIERSDSFKFLIKPNPLNDEKSLKEKKEKWFKSEGQLIIDIYQTETELIIQSAIAGIMSEDIDIVMEKDVITIRGIREKPFEEKGDYFIQECYWGPFSRKIILPVEIDPDRTEASMKEGILTIRMPKTLREKRRKIRIEG